MYVGSFTFLPWFSYVVAKAFHVVSVSRSVFVKAAESHGLMVSPVPRHWRHSCVTANRKRKKKKKENEAANLGDTIMAFRVS